MYYINVIFNLKEKGKKKAIYYVKMGKVGEIIFFKVKNEK